MRLIAYHRCLNCQTMSSSPSIQKNFWSIWDPPHTSIIYTAFASKAPKNWLKWRLPSFFGNALFSFELSCNDCRAFLHNQSLRVALSDELLFCRTFFTLVHDRAGAGVLQHFCDVALRSYVYVKCIWDCAWRIKYNRGGRRPGWWEGCRK